MTTESGRPAIQASNGSESLALVRLEGCLVGAAIGDALGSAAQQGGLEVRKKVAQLSVGDELPASFGAPGRVSFLTQTLLFTLEGLLRAWVRANIKGLSGGVWGCVHHALVRWLATQEAVAPPSFVQGSWPDGWLSQRHELHGERGATKTILEALRGHRGGFGLPDKPKNSSLGSAGLLRGAAIGWDPGLGPEGGPFELARGLTGLTHGHPKAGACAGTLAEAVKAAACTGEIRYGVLIGQRRAIAEGHEALADSVVFRALQEAERGDESLADQVVKWGSGRRSEEALGIGLLCALKSPDFAAGVLAAAAHRGDANTTGAVAGALIGAARGVYAIPEGWRKQVECHELITELARDFYVFVTAVNERGVLDRAWERYPGW